MTISYTILSALLGQTKEQSVYNPLKEQFIVKERNYSCQWKDSMDKNNNESHEKEKNTKDKNESSRIVSAAIPILKPTNDEDTMMIPMALSYQERERDIDLLDKFIKPQRRRGWLSEDYEYYENNLYNNYDYDYGDFVDIESIPSFTTTNDSIQSNDM